MHSEEFKELKQDILDIRDQLSQLMDLFEAVMPEVKEKEMLNLQNKSSESLLSVIENNKDNGTNTSTKNAIGQILQNLESKTSTESLISVIEANSDNNTNNINGSEMEKDKEKEKEEEEGSNLSNSQRKFSFESISENSMNGSINNNTNDGINDNINDGINDSINDNINDGSNSNNTNVEKYVIRRRNKLKKKRKYDPNFCDIEVSHTIITKDVIIDLRTKGYSDVKRHVNEEDIKPINDPIHVSIFYNFGFVLDNEFNKHNAIILYGSAITHNVIHIKMVEKLKLPIRKVNEPFVVKSSLNKFESKECCDLTLALNLGNLKNRMFRELFVVSRFDHHDDMVVVCFSTKCKYELDTLEGFKFKDNRDDEIAFVL